MVEAAPEHHGQQLDTLILNAGAQLAESAPADEGAGAIVGERKTGRTSS